MKKNILILLNLFMIIGLFGCVMDVNQPPTATLPFEPTSLVSAPDSAITKVPVTWAGLNLSGKLVYNTVSVENSVYISKILMLDLTTGELKPIFTSIGDGWIYYVAVASDSKQLIMSYIPPSEAGTESITSLYVLPLEEAATPQILFTPATPKDRYIQVEWSPDGKYIYFVHYNQADQPADQPYPNYQIFKMAYPDGQPEKILDHAFWPRISSDSSKLVYITLDTLTGFNKLFLANADGSNSQEVALSGLPVEVIDAPIFSPDGQSILFSAPIPPQAYQPNWFERLMGVQIVKAHNVPSDWWSAPVTGGTVTRLTQIQTIKLFASMSPDGKHLASVSGEGIFVMDLDGANLNRILFDPGVSSTVNWIP